MGNIMKYQVQERLGSWVVVHAEEPFSQVRPSYPNKKTAEDQLQRLTQGTK
jgi:hypothetical protein